jgi:hypothetical protein
VLFLAAPFFAVFARRSVRPHPPQRSHPEEWATASAPAASAAATSAGRDRAGIQKGEEERGDVVCERLEVGKMLFMEAVF